MMILMHHEKLPFQNLSISIQDDCILTIPAKVGSLREKKKNASFTVELPAYI